MACNCNKTINCGCAIKDLGTQCIVHSDSELSNLKKSKNSSLSDILEKIDKDSVYWSNSIVPKGQWISGTAYNKGDAVVYGGSGYISIVSNNTYEPNTDVWKLLVEKGEDGTSLTYEDLTEFQKQEFANLVPAIGDIVIDESRAVSGDTVEKYTLKKVNNINELRLTEGGYEGQIITLLGYYEGGDKEPLNYKWSYEQGTDDGGAVINTDSGSWNIILNGVFDVKHFGIFPNNIDHSNNFIKLLEYINTLYKGDFGENSAYIGWLEPTIIFDNGKYLLHDIEIPISLTRFNLQSKGRTSILGIGDKESNFLKGSVSSFKVVGFDFYNYDLVFELQTNNIDFSFMDFEFCNFGNVNKVLDQIGYEESRSTSTKFTRCRFSYGIENIADIYTDKCVVKDCWIIHNSNNYMFKMDSNTLFENNVWVPSGFGGELGTEKVYVIFNATDSARSLSFISERFGGENGACPIVLVEDVNKDNNNEAYRNQGISFKDCVLSSNSTYNETNRNAIILKKPLSKNNSINYLKFETCSFLPDLSTGVVGLFNNDSTIVDNLADNFVIEFDTPSYESAIKGVNIPCDVNLKKYIKRDIYNKRIKGIESVNGAKINALQTTVSGNLKASFSIDLETTNLKPFSFLINCVGYGDNEFFSPGYSSVSTYVVSITSGFTSQKSAIVSYTKLHTGMGGASLLVNSDITKIWFENNSDEIAFDSSVDLGYVELTIFFGNKLVSGDIYITNMANITK